VCDTVKSSLAKIGRATINRERLPARLDRQQNGGECKNFRRMLDFPIRMAGQNDDQVLLISCAGDSDTGGGLCVFDGTAVSTIDRVSTAGLTVFDGRLARLLRTPLSTGTGEILLYDHRGISQYLRVDELCDAHYMVWDGQHLIVSSTGDNSLLWLTLAGEVVRRWRAPGEGDSWHLNEAYLVGNRLYGCAFGKSEEYAGYKKEMDKGVGFVFDVESGREVVRGLCAPHNPRYVDGAWTVCDSGRSLVVQFDAVTARELRHAKLRSFTRGLTVTDDFWVVGESGLRNGEGGSRTGSFAILRRDDLDFVERFELPFREVSDIVVAPRSLAEAAKIGFRTNPMRVRESDQLQMFRDLGREPVRLWATSDALEPRQCRVRVEAAIPGQWLPGKLKLVDCKITNLGEAFLCSELPHPVYISYKWKSGPDSPNLTPAEGIRSRLPRTLPPGDSLRNQIEILAPDVEGEFQLVVTLVQELVAWFDAIDAGNACTATVQLRPAG
jgi:Domain of unknown function (DUF4915)